MIAIGAILTWFILFWLIGLYDILHKREYLYIPAQLFGFELSCSVRQVINVLFFPAYALYHACLGLLKWMRYIFYSIFWELLIMGMLRIIALGFKALFLLIFSLFD